MAELATKRAHEIELRENLREIRHAIDAYKSASDDGRIARKANESGYPPACGFSSTACRTPRC